MTLTDWTCSVGEHVSVRIEATVSLPVEDWTAYYNVEPKDLAEFAAQVLRGWITSRAFEEMPIPPCNVTTALAQVTA